jgi:hypothetical protein
LLTGASPVQGRLLSNDTNGLHRTAAVTTVNNGVANYVFEYPLEIPEKTTIEATAVGTANNNSVSSMFILLLVKNSTGY